MENERIDEIVNQLGLGELVFEALGGNIDLSVGAIFDWIISNFFSEIGSVLIFMRQMIIIAILSAIFKAMSSSFANNGISKLGTYVCYILIIATLFQTFTIVLSVMTSMISGIANLLMGSTPIIVTLLASGGFAVSAGAFSGVLIFASTFFTFLAERLMVPLLISAASISLVGYLAEKESLDKLSKLMQKGISFALKSIALVFVSVLTFQRLATPVANNIAIRGTRTVVAAVPVVGQALSSAIDTALYYGQAVRGVVSASLLLSALAICIVPIIQIAAFVFTYKLTAALITPICDERVAEAIDTTGNYAALALGVCVLVGFLFVFIVLLTLSL